MKLKKIVKLLLVGSFIFLSGCQKQYKLYSKNFMGPFDTVTTYMSYAESQDEFDKQGEYIEEQLKLL